MAEDGFKFQSIPKDMHVPGKEKKEKGTSMPIATLVIYLFILRKFFKNTS